MTTKADIMILETYLNEHWWRMRPKLLVQHNGVLFNWGSNGIRLEIEDLGPLLRVIDPEEGITPGEFIRDLLFPFIRAHA